MSAIVLGLAVVVMAAALVPLLLRDARRAEARQRARARMRQLGAAVRMSSLAIGAAFMPSMQKAVAAAIDMESQMRKIDAVIAGAGARLAEMAEMYANMDDQP